MRSPALRRGASWMALAVTLGAVLAGLDWTGPPRSQLTGTALPMASADLFSDASGALFPGSTLAAGHTVTRCLRVTYLGSAGAGTVRLSAENLSGPLLPYLTTTVQVGTGGGFSACTGFSGVTVYSGPLAGLAVTDPAAPGIDGGWHATGAVEYRVYAVSIAIADTNAAQGLGASTTFRWDLVPSGQPAPSPQPVTVPPTDNATTVPTSPPGSAPPTDAAPSGPASATATPSASASATGGDRVGRSPAPGGGPGKGQGKGSGLADAWRAATRVVEGTVRHSAIPLSSLLIMLVFLAVQDRIDRRDPKLALAPLTGDPFVRFDETPGAGPDDEES